jgi:hypothetical protein
MNRAKAFTDGFVSGNGGGAHGASHSLVGAPLRCIMSRCTGSLRVKTLSLCGCATAALWRRALLGGVGLGAPTWLSGGGGWLVVSLARGDR